MVILGGFKMDKLEFTLPERNQIYKLKGVDQRLEIIKNYGVASTLTDFSLLLDGGSPILCFRVILHFGPCENA